MTTVQPLRKRRKSKDDDELFIDKLLPQKNIRRPKHRTTQRLKLEAFQRVWMILLASLGLYVVPFQMIGTSKTSIFALSNVSMSMRTLGLVNITSDFGGLDFRSVKEREISLSDANRFEEYRLKYLESIDYHLKGASSLIPEKDEVFDPSRDCHELTMQWDTHPNCNAVHEFLQIEGAKPLGHGDFRQSFLVYHAWNNESLVVKAHRVLEDKFGNHSYNPNAFRDVARDAIVMERMTASPHVESMYTYCGTTLSVPIMREASGDFIPYKQDDPGEWYRGRISQADLDKLQTKGVHSFNSLILQEKLTVALDLAQGLSDLHGHKDGPIIHGDFHPDQLLWDTDGKIIIGDFNLAVFMEWSYEKKKYCDFFASFNGNYKAPEEHKGDFTDESCDIFSFGNMIYNLLTGLYPHYDLIRGKDIRKRLVAGELGHVDARYLNRSYIEGRLVQLMQKCWKFHPKDRISAFDAVKFLQETQANAK